MPTNRPIVNRARAATLLLEHAERIDLPLPYSIEATDYTSELRLMLRNLADLTTWALAIETPIEEQVIGQKVHHTVDGRLLDQRIHLAVITTNHRAAVRA